MLHYLATHGQQEGPAIPGVLPTLPTPDHDRGLVSRRDPPPPAASGEVCAPRGAGRRGQCRGDGSALPRHPGGRTGVGRRQRQVEMPDAEMLERADDRVLARLLAVWGVRVTDPVRHSRSLIYGGRRRGPPLAKAGSQPPRNYRLDTALPHPISASARRAATNRRSHGSRTRARR